MAGDGATPVAEVESAPLSQIVERVLSVSDNEAAEVLAHQVGLATVGEASFAGGVPGVEQAWPSSAYRSGGASRTTAAGCPGTTGSPPRPCSPCSGSRPPTTIPSCGRVLTGLPVAGFTGSLEYRFADAAPAARGRVRAKTGTLPGRSALAGVATDLDGTSVAFVLIADRVALLKTLAAREALDAAAAALAGCHCSVGRRSGQVRAHDRRRDDRLGPRDHRRVPARGPGPEVSRAEAEAVVAELRDDAARSTGLVRDFTGLVAADHDRATAPLLVVDRPGWIRANTESFDALLIAGRRQGHREEGPRPRASARPSARG